jgi:uncharacterized membrane protein YphA (DoxX/SURF4 family)
LNGLYKIIRWLLGGVFLYAGITKLLEPESFAVLIEAYGIVPQVLLLPVALLLPLLEAAAGIGLLFDVRGSLSAIAVLLVVFIALLAYGIRLGLDVDCGCFGPGDPEAEAFHGLWSSLYRDLWMVAGVIYLYFFRRCRGIRPRALRLAVNPFPRFTIKRRRKDGNLDENMDVDPFDGADPRNGVSGCGLSGQQVRAGVGEGGGRGQAGP